MQQLRIILKSNSRIPNSFSGSGSQAQRWCTGIQAYNSHIKHKSLKKHFLKLPPPDQWQGLHDHKTAPRQHLINTYRGWTEFFRYLLASTQVTGHTKTHWSSNPEEDSHFSRMLAYPGKCCSYSTRISSRVEVPLEPIRFLLSP